LKKWTEYRKEWSGKLRRKEKYLREGEGKKKERRQKTKRKISTKVMLLPYVHTAYYAIFGY
jgi:hypothetical protein